MRLYELIVQADLGKPPQELLKSIKRKALLTAPPAILLGFISYRLTHQLPILITIAAATLLYTFYDIIKLSGAAYQRRQEIETELPFTATLITMAANHSTPTATLANTLHIPSLKRTSREYLNILKYSHLYHTTPAQAANKLAENHPSTRFQTFLRAISAAERGVGDPHSSLSDIARAELESAHHQTEIASEKLGVASSTVLMMFAVLPLTLTVFSLITNQPSLLTLSYTTTIPSLILVNFLIEQAYPQTLKPHTSKPPPLLLIGCVAAFLGAFEALRPLPLPFSVAAGFNAFTLPIAIYYTSAAREHSKLISTLPQLSRDIAEEAKKGSPPTAAMRKLIASLKYPKNLLISLYDRRRPRPYVAQAYMDMLTESEKLGASSEELELVAETFNAIANTHSSYRSKSSFFKLTAYASAGILAAASVAITTTIKKLSTPLDYTPMFTAGLLPHITPNLQMYVDIAIIVNSYLLGLLAGKAHTGSFPLGLLDSVVTTTIATVILIIGGVI
ncbi:hypothetical protein B9Q04_00325 [Candidatus Marsarchaeota G2 archaeon BE_D]|jgi:Flp pilus assembly protein TadB|uniref:Type II secretion system protein GspF domain-containing protein n=4 Tax=Candidatus Marsarchaeota group 2 TaxID=2203771 RepID=A0A2R6CF03_9ARCH|nr:MAG: hypothetical protein B9Q06_00705 [Candidatus Marsarchaeota G2 archaeon ECH_B_2]PSO01267.1 MAG: hypothetical protein B9Q07_00110 [Candidatus Marsarchaeota G2 archaeon ECH_B_3]PSO03401.1 MAG: hypothetical protein B9Q05_00705 [Candidatus Marsarchaeota G2 archaeon ECH_B_1]PSO09469.1 MAG: hypothetical protein B9Q04_00325 [Candidatus Marsarchaeota G2 archaeon BE_D]